MKRAWRVLLGLVILAAIIALPVFNWSEARKYAERGTLRWCVVAQAPVSSGDRVNEQDVGLTITRVTGSDICVADVRRAIGKYATSRLVKDELVRASNLSEAVPARVPADGAAVPVEVKTEHAGSVTPGTRLVFVQEKGKAVRMIPARKGKGAKRKWHGLEVISVAVSGKDASTTILTVAVEPADVALVPALATGQWRPVILELK